MLTHSCKVLGRCLQVRTNSADIRHTTQYWLRAFPACARLQRTFDLVVSITLAPATSPGGKPLLNINEQAVGEYQNAWQVLPLLQMQIGAYLPGAVTDYVLLHAGAVGRRGGGVLLPAASGGGKSTLTLSLFLRGMDYYSDEVGVISPGGELHPFPKPIASRNPELHASLAARPEVWVGPAMQPDGPVWYAHASDMRPGSTAPPVPIRHLVFPQYAPGEPARLEPMSANDAMRALLANTVNFAALPAQALETLGHLARTAPAYRLISADPTAAAELVAGLS